MKQSPRNTALGPPSRLDVPVWLKGTQVKSVVWKCLNLLPYGVRQFIFCPFANFEDRPRAGHFGYNLH